jgi:signal transduction histidine kinase
VLVYRASAAAALRALVDALQSTRPLDDVLAELLSQVRAFLAADEAYVLILQGDVMVVRAAEGLPPGAVGRALDRHHGLEGAAATVRQTIAVADAARHRLHADPFGRREQPGAFVATPMLVRGRESGLLVAARHSSGQFGDASIWWLELLAGLAAVVVAQDEAVHFQEQRARQAELLLGLAEAAPDEPGQFLGQLAATIGQGVSADDVTLLLHDPERGALLATGPLGQVQENGAPREHVPLPSEHPAARAFESGRPVVVGDLSADGRVRPRRGQSGPRSVAAVPLRVGGETRGVLMVASRQPGAFAPDDVAFLTLVAARVGVLLEREEVRRRRSDSRAREEFVGVVSHELKTPVAVIQAYLELLQRRAEREGRRSDLEVLGHVTGQTSRMLAMIEELLDVQRIEAGVLALELSRFDLGQLVERVAAELQVTTAQHRLVAEAGPVEVVADRRRVEEVLTNLIENAIKYSPEGGEVRVRVVAEGPTALIEVVDQGIGISAEDQPRVFERFFRASGAGERLHKGHHGLGLGLYIARELVRRHGGEMGVRSTAGTGSVFWFRLPRDGPEPAG